MNSHSMVRAVSAISLLATVTLSAAPVEAASRSSYSNYWNYSSRGEGQLSSTTAQRAYSRSNLSSSAQKAIKALDKDPVDELPIPVLLGVQLSSISPNFGDPRDGGARSHEGEDILAPKDDYIVSPTDAVVISKGSGESSGNYVSTANPGGETFIYMHLDTFAEDLKVGTILKEGDLIGYVGDTGNAAGGPTHVHFEIRHGKTATDPFPRLTRSFTTEERVEYVTRALKDADDKDEDAHMLVQNYRSTFIAARASGIELPEEIERELGTSSTSSTGSGTYSRDLTVGSQGDDVTALQSFLIEKAVGPKAAALTASGATGYFGSITQSALAEYQASIGITPAAGYFGALTRVKVGGS